MKTPTRLIVPEEYLTPEMAKLARALGFVDPKLRAFKPGELSAMKTAGMRVHYEVLGRGTVVIAHRYGLAANAVVIRLRAAGVRMRPWRYYGKLNIHRHGIDQVVQAAKEAA